MTLTVYPAPSLQKARPGRLNLAGRTHITLHKSLSTTLTAAFARFAEQRGLTLSHGQPPKDQVLLDVQQGRGGPAGGPINECYRLTAGPDGLLLEARQDAGLYWGLMTLDQILQDQATGSLPCFLIEDAPVFEHRGVMLDISRCKVPTLNTLKQLIDAFSRLKINQLQLYTEHTFAFVNHAQVWAAASPLTASDILHLKAYAQERFIELVPNLNCFGHFERWLAHPTYQHLAECPEGFTHPLTGAFIPTGSTLRPNRESLRLLDELHAEYLPLFDSKHFNIGGDEPWELGQGASRQRCDKEGTSRVYIDFLTQIQKLVKKRDRSMMFWSDIVLKDPASLKHLPKDLTALNWGYEANHPFKRECEQMADSRLPFYVCPGTSSWNSLTGRTDNMIKNISAAARHGQQTGAQGLLVTDWGDHGHHQYLPISYPGFVMAACQAWKPGNAAKINLADGVNRVFMHDPTSPIGQGLLNLGRILEAAPSPIRNATIFNRLLFWQMRAEPSATRKITDRELANCLDEFARLENAMDRTGNQLETRELINALRLARHGVWRLQHFRGQSLSQHDLAQDLSGLMAEHAELWLARNRAGGLPESLGHLARSRDALSALS